jgi:hypothetical protein
MVQNPDKFTPMELAKFAASNESAAADMENLGPSESSSTQTSNVISPATTNVSWTSNGSTQVAASRISHIMEQVREQKRDLSPDSDDEKLEQTLEQPQVRSQRRSSWDDQITALPIRSDSRGAIPSVCETKFEEEDENACEWHDAQVREAQANIVVKVGHFRAFNSIKRRSKSEAD